MKITVIELGILLNSALYLAMVFTAGILTRNPLAWKLAAITVGLCYIAYMVQSMHDRAPEPLLYGIASGFVILSILTGLAAGVVLL